MKTLTIIMSLSVFAASGRLIDKNTEKISETSPTEPTTPVRMSRQAFYDDGIGISREDSVQPQDDRPYIRKGRYSIKVMSSDAKGRKDAKESHFITAVTKAVAPESEETQPPKTLVKKPIPKFNEVDYEDFQGKINTSPVKFADSGEHEDEDFNLDDYDFDVNHDEFASGGKPLEPRIKYKQAKSKPEQRLPKVIATTMPPPEIKIQSKVVIPTEPLVRTKNGPSKVKKSADKMKEDYYDDIVTTTKAPEVEVKSDESSEESDESTEYNNNKKSVRMVRSPGIAQLIANKMSDPGATVMAKLLKSMPPIVPILKHEVFPIGADVISDVLVDQPMVDPKNGKRFMF